jgi:hypothetical protein
MDRSAKGVTGEPFEVVVELGKIREFTAATWTRHPAFDAGRTSPPTFLTTARFWQPEAADPWPAVDIDPQRSLLAEQEFIFHGPPPAAGTRLTAQARIEDFFEKEGRRGGPMTFAVMVTEFRDADGRLVAEARQTGVEVSTTPEGDGAA